MCIYIYIYVSWPKPVSQKVKQWFPELDTQDREVGGLSDLDTQQNVWTIEVHHLPTSCAAED